MDVNPWASPWATPVDEPVPRLDAAPVTAAADGAARVGAWGDEDDDGDGWGGWAGGTETASSPAWEARRSPSPELSPAAPAVVEADVSPGAEWLAEEEEAGGDQDGNTEQEPSRAESPVEEEPPGAATRAVERGAPARQASKVQVLVDMYDGIARNASSATTDKMSSSSPTGVPFPDGDGSNRHDGEEPSAAAHHASDDDEGPPAERQDAEPRVDLPAPDTGTPHPLDALFPSTAPISVVPDRLADTSTACDGFARASERRAWHRVSRFGPMRKHNAGDDEYVRVDWGRSTARGETLAIVRRWMEEDSIAGRVTLGGYGGGGGGRVGGGGGGRAAGGAAAMFNWDSSAPPVEIAHLLRGSREAADRAPAAGPHGGSPVTGAEGRSQGGAESDAARAMGPTQSLPRPRSPLAPARPSENMDWSEKPKLAAMPIPAPIRDPGVDENEDGDDDDDDGWGEMVSGGPADGGTWQADEHVVVPAPEPTGEAKLESPLPPDEPEATALDVSDPGVEEPSTESATNKSPTAPEPKAPASPPDSFDDEGCVARTIVSSLPDLSYMLR